MAQVIGTCDKCGGLVTGLFVDATGVAWVDPKHGLEHWKVSPVCEGAVITTSLGTIVDAHETGETLALRSRMQTQIMKIGALLSAAATAETASAIQVHLEQAAELAKLLP